MKETLGDHADDLPYLVDALPWFLVGAPDDIIKRIREFEEMGVDEVILRMDGHGHHKIMESIEMFGKYVLPEFQNPGNIDAIVDMKSMACRRHRICCSRVYSLASELKLA